MIKIEGYIGWDTTADSIASQLRNKSGDITIRINSGGGIITEGLEISRLLNEYDGIVTAQIAYAGSMATIIASACDVIHAFDDAIYFAHNAQGGAHGDNRELARKSTLLESLNKLLAKKYKKRTGKTNKEIRKMMNDDTFFFGEEIVDNGFADLVIESKKAKTKEEAYKQSDNYNDDSRNAIGDTKALSEIMALCEGDCKTQEKENSTNSRNSTEGKSMPKVDETVFAQQLADASAVHESEMTEKNKEIDKLKASSGEFAIAQATRLKEVMGVIPTNLRDDATVQEKMFNADTTVNDMKAFLFDLGAEADNKIIKKIDSESVEANEDMLNITSNSDVSNTDENSKEQEANAIKAYAEANEGSIS